MRRAVTGCDWRTGVAVLIACAATSGRAAAQTRDDAGLWLSLFANRKFEALPDDSNLRYWFDGQSRFLEDAGGFSQLLIRPGLGYTVRDNQTVWAGYAYIRTAPTAPGVEFDEHRIWQQWLYTPTVDDWAFLLRGRLEQRWVETGNDVGLRFRQMARAQYNLTASPQWSVIAWDEAFFHLNDTDWGAKAGFDQNRAFLGVGFKPTPTAGRFEVGYLNQFIYRRGGENSMNHIVSLSLFF